MTEKEHLEQIAVTCREIENSIKHIKRQSEYLEENYGIMLTDASMLSGLSVHVYAGLELVEKALKKKAVESKRIFRHDNIKRKFVSRGVEWFQISQTYGEKWLEANPRDNARFDLKERNHVALFDDSPHDELYDALGNFLPGRAKE